MSDNKPKEGPFAEGDIETSEILCVVHREDHWMKSLKREKMVILELRFQDLVLKEYTLEKGGSLTIGRHPDNDIVPKDETVSNHHAIIERKGEKLIVLDKESKNGTFVNGIKVQSAELNDEDIVKIGNELNVKVFTISAKKRKSIITEEPADKSAVFTTIERTLDKL